jgi:protein-S-isoprenylcysteine O-methyltransferase Ste14
MSLVPAMRVLENRIPPPVVAALFGFVMWLLADAMPDFRERGIVGIILVAGLVLCGSVFCIAGLIAFRRARTTVNPLKPGSASSMVSSGIYRLSRNPMYVGFALFLAAWGVWLASLWSIPGVLGFIVYITRFQIVPEERAMRSLFGAEFAEYSRRVRRWL